MKKYMIRFSTFTLLCLCNISPAGAYGVNNSAQQELKSLYEHHSRELSDIAEHLPVLRQLAMECSSVVEIGLRNMISSWGILEGLSASPARSRSYLGIDIVSPPIETLNLAVRLAKANEISFYFMEANDLNIDIEPADMLFIDSLHTYLHLTYELEKFSPKIRKYITMHDTSPPWGYADDCDYRGNYSEYPSHYDRSKKGLWPAVEDFLKRHPEWSLLERRVNCYGFTILKRVSD